MFNGSKKFLVASLLALSCVGGLLSSCKSASSGAKAKNSNPALSQTVQAETAEKLPEPSVASSEASEASAEVPAAAATPTVQIPAPETPPLPKPSGVIPNIYLVEGIEIPSALRYSSDVVAAEGESSKPQKYRISRVRPRREDAELPVGGLFQNRYLVDSHSASVVEGGKTMPAVIALKDTLTGALIVLPFQAEVANPQRFGDFEFRGETNTRLQHQEGDIFKLPNDRKTEYQLIGFDPGGALVRKVRGGDLLRIPVPSAPASAPAELLPEE